MAEIAIIMPMTTATNIAASILGMIQRRCGTSQAILELVSKSTEHLGRIRELLMTLEDGSHDLPAAHEISTALNHQREEFVAVLQKLQDMERHSKYTKAFDRT